MQYSAIVQNIEANNVFTSDVLGHLLGISSTIFLVPTDPSTPLMGVLCPFCRWMDVRSTVGNIIK